MTTTLTVDHPGWITGPAGEPVRLVLHEGVPWLADWQPAAGLILRPIGTSEASAPPAPHTTPHELPTAAEAALGIESGSDRILHAMDKRITAAMTENVAGRLMERGINVKGYFMADRRERAED